MNNSKGRGLILIYLQLNLFRTVRWLEANAPGLEIIKTTYGFKMRNCGVAQCGKINSF